MHRIFKMPVSTVYQLYIKKLERKGRTQEDLDQIITWLTGFSKHEIDKRLSSEENFETFFAEATLNPNAKQIAGVICGVRVEEIEDPLMQKIRYMDKLVDELYKGRPMEKVLRD